MFIKQKKITNYIFATILSFSMSQALFAQMKTLSNFYVAESTTIGINGALIFATSNAKGIITTAKTGTKGYVTFNEKSTWEGAGTNQFVDGYVKVLHNEPFVFPIGDNGSYHPIAIDGAANTSAAYYDKKTSKLHKSTSRKLVNTTNKPFQILEQGYWALEGSQSTNLTLMWDRSMAINTLIKESLASLIIVGFRNGEWEEIPSVVDKYTFDDSNHSLLNGDQLSTIDKGTISANIEIIPNDYEYYTIGTFEVPTSKVALEVYPNPVLVDQSMNISYELPEEEQGILQIHSASGSLLKAFPLNIDKGVIELSNIISHQGSYNVSIILSTGKTIMKKMAVLEK